MGIKFYCPQGHKLHVKSFLAGKRGICPHCQTRVRIPRENSIRPDKPGPNSSADLFVFPQETSPQPETRDSDGEMADPSVVSVIGDGPKQAPVPDVAIGTSAPQKQRKESQAPPQRTPSQPEVPSDPLAEVPTARWYVRPVSGGEFGPAPAELMRDWIREGRVGRDSQVWREGWDNWRTADLVFDLGNVSPPVAEDTDAPAVELVGDALVNDLELDSSLPDSPLELDDNRPIRTPSNRRSKPRTSLMIVIVLGMAILGLLPILFYVISN